MKKSLLLIRKMDGETPVKEHEVLYDVRSKEFIVTSIDYLLGRMITFAVPRKGMKKDWYIYSQSQFEKVKL